MLEQASPCLAVGTTFKSSLVLLMSLPYTIESSCLKARKLCQLSRGQEWRPLQEVSSFGSSEWQGWVLYEKDALPLLAHTYEVGIRTWDTICYRILVK